MYTAGEQDDHEGPHRAVPAIRAPRQGPWQGPTDLESELYRLARCGDSYGYLRRIAAEGLYRPVPLTRTGRRRIASRRLATRRLEDGRTLAYVYTAGVLPRPHPYLAYEATTLGEIARSCPRAVDVLAVNAATPCARFFPAHPHERRVWTELHEELHDPEALRNRLLTRRTGTPAPGDLRHGLACGALPCYEEGEPWNAADWHGRGHGAELQWLGACWGVRTRQDWLDVQERLLRRELSPWHWEFVLGARPRARPRHGGTADPVRWREGVEAELRAAVGVRAGEDPALDACVRELRELVGAIVRYEARFRADGILAGDGAVRSVAAWDLGCASMTARRGMGARLASAEEARRALERAGSAARTAYASWDEYAAGYLLGRCLTADAEQFGEWYVTGLAAHRALATDPDSPWRTVPYADG
ncbi:DUF1266 domain-containing protein [Streptomyces sp. ODS28]|uniref:DUF1266 domain-containing protein n=1 Tax=Streptomyces sp. ODS28 TaxID=3136688 RepID=UPI0031EBB99B